LFAKQPGPLIQMQHLYMFHYLLELSDFIQQRPFVNWWGEKKQLKTYYDKCMYF